MNITVSGAMNAILMESREKMIKLWFLILFNLVAAQVFGQSNPHGGDFDISCSTCHTSAEWNDVSGNNFDHDQTVFPLAGAHKKANCIACHKTLKFNQAAANCFQCHTDYHKNELGNACGECHNEYGWDDRTRFMEFHNQTDFPLNGAHAVLDCESCHLAEQQRQYANTPVACAECHLDVFMTTLNPDHQKAGFDLQCHNCHSTTSKGWQHSSVFAHAKNFPLTGGHGGLNCEDCHEPDYNIQKVACVDCHQAAFDGTVNPDHRAFSFTPDCEECHTGISWQKTVFSHLAVSGFAIEGRHKEIWCSECHLNNQLTGLPLTCVGCHQQEYNNAADPNHIAAHFPTTCENCHSAKNWEPANWDHDGDYFPIYSGNHKNEWNECADCHVYPGNYAQFECINCHEHSQSRMDDKHRNRRNYVYESQACYNCHPRGKE